MSIWIWWRIQGLGFNVSPGFHPVPALQDEDLELVEDLGGNVMSLETSRECARLLAMMAASGCPRVQIPPPPTLMAACGCPKVQPPPPPPG